MWKLLERIGTAATLGDLLLKILPAGVLSLGVAVWGLIEGLSPLLLTLATAFAFLVVLWIGIGFLWLKDRRRPPTSTVAWNYTFGVELVNTSIVAYAPDGNHISEFAIGLNLRNTTAQPVICIVTRFHGSLNTRVGKGAEKHTPMLLHIGGIRTYHPAVAPNDVNLPPGKLFAFKGDFDLELKYGHPDLGLFRVYSATGTFTAERALGTGETISSRMTLLSEKDVALEKPEAAPHRVS